MREVFFLLLVLLPLYSYEIHAQQNSTIEQNLIGYENFQSQPEYPGGMDAFNTYITSAVKNSELYKGKWMIISFIIKSDGTVEEMSILKSMGRRVDKQVTEAMKTCKKWKPAYKDNAPVEAQLNLPIRF